MYEDNPMMYIGDVLEGAMFHGSTLGELISGTRQSVTALKRTQLLNFWQRYYHPNNMLLVTAGQLPESLDKLIAKTFGQVRAAGARGQFKPFVPHQRAPQVALHFKATEQVQAALGFPAFGWGDKRLPALKLLTTILGGNMSSRLFIRLREQEGLCYSVSASIDAFRGTGLLAVTAGLDQARLPLAIKLIRQELAKIVSTRVGEDEIARAKEYSRGRLTLALEDSAAQAEWVGKRWFLDGSRDTTAQYLKRLSAVTARELQAVAKQVLSPRQATLALIGPFRKIEPWRKLLN